MQTQLQQKDVQVAFLHHQIKLRDEIIEEQKSVIQSNKIKTKISYNYLQNLEEIADQARINFPIIKKSLDQLGIIQYSKGLGGTKKPFLKEKIQLDNSEAPKLPKIQTTKS